MIESALHLLKIHRKMIFGNSSVIVQDMLRKTPKPLNAVDMVFAAKRCALPFRSFMPRREAVASGLSFSLVWPQEESNPYFKLRKLASYPLNDEAVIKIKN